MSVSLAVDSRSVSRADRMAAVRLWLYGVAVLVFLMVLVGGATRLTGSGLSITEWKPVTGIVPPLTQAGWAAEFAKYQAIPQFRLLNAGMSLSDFKFIYWWEWSHRLLGRAVGLAFALPFLWFLCRGLVDRRLAWRLGGILALGAFQGLIGWYMVASGLVDRTSVSQYRLAFHLTLACAVLAALLWTARSLVPRDRGPLVSRRLRTGGLVHLGLVFAQIYLGALVAGLHAGLAYNTWPLMEGRLVPPSPDLFVMAPAWRNFFENALTVQFDHRITAYAVLLTAAWLAWEARAASRIRTAAFGLLGLVLGQVALGIATLLHAAPLALALAHQAAAIMVLAAATVLAQELAAARRLETAFAAA